MMRGRDQMTTVSDLVEKWVPVCAVNVASFSELLYPVALRNTDLSAWFLTSDLSKKPPWLGCPTLKRVSVPDLSSWLYSSTVASIPRNYCVFSFCVHVPLPVSSFPN